MPPCTTPPLYYPFSEETAILEVIEARKWGISTFVEVCVLPHRLDATVHHTVITFTVSHLAWPVLLAFAAPPAAMHTRFDSFIRSRQLPRHTKCIVITT